MRRLNTIINFSYYIINSFVSPLPLTTEYVIADEPEEVPAGGGGMHGGGGGMGGMM